LIGEKVELSRLRTKGKLSAKKNDSIISFGYGKMKGIFHRDSLLLNL